MENAEGLTYDSEYNLSREPLKIDLLVFKKIQDEVIKNEIGKIFLGHNIMEYKSPDDNMNINTFYKVLSYAWLYKADTGAVGEILDTDITQAEELLERYDKLTEEEHRMKAGVVVNLVSDINNEVFEEIVN